jgi:hypothetical protein
MIFQNNRKGTKGEFMLNFKIRLTVFVSVSFLDSAENNAEEGPKKKSEKAQ